MFCALAYYEPKPGKPQELDDLILQGQLSRDNELLNHLTWQGQLSRDKEPGTLRYEIYIVQPSKWRSGTGYGLYVYRAFTDREAFNAHFANNEALQYWRSAGLQEKLIYHSESEFVGEPIFSFSR